MTRSWVVTAAVLAFLHAVLSLIGAMGMTMTADQADPMTTDEALGVAGLIALMAVAMVVAGVLLLVGYPWPVLAVAVSSLAISAYTALRWADESFGYQVPVFFAVLPALVVGIVGVQVRGRARAVTA